MDGSEGGVFAAGEFLQRDAAVDGIADGLAIFLVEGIEGGAERGEVFARDLLVGGVVGSVRRLDKFIVPGGSRAPEFLPETIAERTAGDHGDEGGFAAAGFVVERGAAPEFDEGVLDCAFDIGARGVEVATGEKLDEAFVLVEAEAHGVGIAGSEAVHEARARG